MIKKILTTKAHLVVLFLGVIYVLYLSQFVFFVGTWDLNRSIGWGWDYTDYIWYYSFYFNLLWVIIFPIVYWFLSRKYFLSFPLIVLHIFVIVLLLFSAFLLRETILFIVANWILFFANIVEALLIPNLMGYVVHLEISFADTLR